MRRFFRAQIFTFHGQRQYGAIFLIALQWVPEIEFQLIIFPYLIIIKLVDRYHRHYQQDSCSHKLIPLSALLTKLGNASSAHRQEYNTAGNKQIPVNGDDIIPCHIGNGGSITAIKDGKSVDTSMGMTPVEGLMMGTRSGDVDAGVLTYLMDKKHLDSAGVANLVNKKSGVAGISGLSSDMRDIEAGVAAKNERAILALQMYEYRITKYIGAYAAALGGVDIIVFTGGVGENQTITREAVCKPLAFMGVEIDPEINKQIHGTECVISTPASKVKVVVIPTDEEYMIASDTKAVLSGKMQ